MPCFCSLFIAELTFELTMRDASGSQTSLEGKCVLF